MLRSYDVGKDFVVDFEFVWKWCGFTRKSDAKRVLEKHFVIDIDFLLRSIAPPTSAAKVLHENEELHNRGGHNKER